MTHNYKRNRTTTLFAAFDVLESKVIGRCTQKHRHQEFIRFLNQIEARIPDSRAVHVILDNYATHKHPKVRKSLDRHPRFTFHFTPTSSSWLNAVEGFFAKLSRRRLKRGIFRSVRELNAAINRSSTRPIMTQDPSHGPQTQTKSSPPVRFDPLDFVSVHLR
jgi:transposase